MSSAVQQFSVSASAAVAAMQRNRVDHVVTVPDWVQLALHQQLEAGVAGMRLVNCSSENQVVTVAAGLVIGGKRPLLVMQNQGLYNCINTLRAVCLDAMVRIMEPLLQSIGVPFMCLDGEQDLPRMDQAFAMAEQQSGAVVLLVSAPMAWA